MIKNYWEDNILNEIEAPLVSVIIPCYNSEEYISECIKSVLEQDYPLIEIIVIDDGSTDRSISAIKKYSSIILIQQENSGACVARNKGIEVSKGKYIKFLDSDDKFEPNIIGIQVGLAENLSDNTIVYGDYYILRDEKKVFQSTLISVEDQTEQIIMNDLLISTPLHRKDMLLKVKGFDDRLHHGQEWNLHVRLSSQGYSFFHHKDIVFQYRIHQSENRITTNRLADKNKVKHDIYKLRITREEMSTYCTGDVDAAFALSYWWIGRWFYRQGDLENSLYYINTAKKLTKNYKKFWPLYYSILNNFLGFRNSEFFLKKAYSLKRSKYN